MKIAVLSNINIDTLAKRLKKQCEVYTSEGYGNWVREIVDDNSGLYDGQIENVVIVIDGEEIAKNFIDGFEEYFTYMEKAAESNPKMKFFISNIDVPVKKLRAYKEYGNEIDVENIWNDGLQDIVERHKNIYLFNLKNLITDTGRSNFYSAKMWYLGGMKFSLNGDREICREIEYIVKAQEKKKKCLILDLDNTLWGGVVGEDGISGISLSNYKEGARYKDFQTRIKEMQELGVILAVVSKNNEKDAMDVFQNHPDMVLREEDFVAMKINWESKGDNIRELASELNLGLDSFVFIDDNPVERENVKTMLSEVAVPEFPKDTSELEDFIIRVFKQYFFKLNYSKEDTEKTLMYKQNVIRNEAEKHAVTVEEFLKSLELQVSIRIAKEEEVPRIAELTQKTNQFNLTTKRYSEGDILNMVRAKDYDVYIASVKDRFGDNGNVSVIIIKKDEETKEATLDTFLLSCRVMGRNIEDMIMKYIEKKLWGEGYERLYTEYIPTLKNKPVSNLFDRFGYNIVEIWQSGYRRYYSSLKLEKDFKCYGTYI